MTILEILKRALDWDSTDYSDMPDYSLMLDHLGLCEDDPVDDIRDAIEQEIADMEATGDTGEAEGDTGEE